MECKDYFVNKLIRDIEFCIKHIERNPKQIKSILDRYLSHTNIKDCKIRDYMDLASHLCLDNPRKSKKLCESLVVEFKPESIDCDKNETK